MHALGTRQLDAIYKLQGLANALWIPMHASLALHMRKFVKLAVIWTVFIQQTNMKVLSHPHYSTLEQIYTLCCMHAACDSYSHSADLTLCTIYNIAKSNIGNYFRIKKHVSCTWIISSAMLGQVAKRGIRTNPLEPPPPPCVWAYSYLSRAHTMSTLHLHLHTDESCSSMQACLCS